MKRFINFVKHVHNDEQGSEAIEKLAIILAVALPLLGILIYFKDYLGEWISTDIGKVREEGGFEGQKDLFNN